MTEGEPKGLRRYLPLALLLIGLAAFFALGGGQYISFAYLSAQYETLRAFVAENLLIAALGYAALYILVVAISVPGAAPLTIAGGLLFGTVLGGSLTVVGATIGAVIIFLAARTAFAETLREKAGPRVQKLREGFERDAFNYLLFLRLVPAFPFFLVNIAAGLFGMRLGPYALATALGIIPGTFVFASIGNGAVSIAPAACADCSNASPAAVRVMIRLRPSCSSNWGYPLASPYQASAHAISATPPTASGQILQRN